MTEMDEANSHVWQMKSLFTLVGILPPENKTLKAIYPMWSLFMVFLSFLLPAAAFHHFVFDPLPKIEKLESLLYIAATSHINANLILLIFVKKRAVAILNEIEDLYESLYNLEVHQSDMKRWIKRGKSQSNFFVITYILYSVGSCSVALLQDLETPFAISTLFIPKEYKFFSWTFQIIAMVSSTTIMSTELSYICIVGTSISGLMEVLHKKLLNRGKSMAREERIFTYQLHSKIINLAAEFNQVFGFSLALMNGLSSIQCCVTTYPLAKSGFSVHDVILFAATNVFPIAICETGNSIFIEAEKVCNAAYDNLWYTEDIEDKKDLVIMLALAEKMIFLHYKYVVKFTYETYLSILQMAYSYMAMLRTMEFSNTS